MCGYIDCSGRDARSINDPAVIENFFEELKAKVGNYRGAPFGGIRNELSFEHPDG